MQDTIDDIVNTDLEALAASIPEDSPSSGGGGCGGFSGGSGPELASCYVPGANPVPEPLPGFGFGFGVDPVYAPI
jgi:hypothetical protein